MDPSGGHPIAQTPALLHIDSEGDSDNEDDLENLECYPRGAPSILDSKYLAAQGSRIVLGATRRTGLTAEEAFQASVSRCECHLSLNDTSRCCILIPVRTMRAVVSRQEQANLPTLEAAELLKAIAHNPLQCLQRSTQLELAQTDLSCMRIM